jgi:glutamate dehydrogenase (NAD(P)+)
VRVDPRTLSRGELERLTRRYTSEIGVLIGPDKDIPAPDVNTNEQIMAWMMDTYSINQGRTVTGVVTGKPVALGGSLGRREATGRGVFIVGRSAARKLGLDLAGARVAIQGYGNVGATAARCFASAGAKIVALQDVTGTIHNGDGIDLDALQHWLDGGGTLGQFPGAMAIAHEDFWSVETDILVPAALEGQIDRRNANDVKARLVLEGANGPTTPEADDILTSRGVTIVPDVLTNAGGVTVSYFEWVQDFSSFFWTEQEINERLERILSEAFEAVWKAAQEHRVTLRTAAYLLACRRVLEARQLRGIYP